MNHLSLARSLDIDGPVNYLDFGGRGAPMVLVHGLAGSVENWLAVGPRLAELAHVVALDLRGFGRTPLDEGSSASVEANSELLERFVATLFDEPATLVGNSMGGMISLLLAARRPELVRDLVLVDAALPHPPGVEVDPVVLSIFSAYATPGAGEELVRASEEQLGPEGLVRQTMALCCSDVSRVDPVVMDAHVALGHERAAMPWAVDALLEAARSLIDLNARPDDYYDTIRSIECPALLIHGSCDRLIPTAAVEVLAEMKPSWKLEVYDDIGHVPMLEAPERFVASVAAWKKDPLRV